MSKNNEREERSNDREDDLEVIGHEVSPEEAELDNDSTTTVSKTSITRSGEDANDQDDEPNHDDDDDRREEANDDLDEEPAPRRNDRREQRGQKESPFLKRLKRTERIVQEVRDENAQLVENNNVLRTQIETISRKGDVEKVKAESEKKLEDIRARLKVAKESGDTDAEVKLIEEMADAKADVKKAEALAEAAKTTGGAGAPVERYRRLADQWKRKHQRFNTDPAFKAAVIAIDKQVADDGFNRNGDDYWKEVDKRVKKMFPNEYRDMPPRREHPAKGGDGGGNNGRADGNANRTTRKQA